MRPKIGSEFRLFTDGAGTVWKVEDRKLTTVKQSVFHFAVGTSGERRFWDMFVADTSIEMAIFVPENTNVSEGDVVIIQDKQFDVVKVDYKVSGKTRGLLLSLTSASIKYRS